MSFEARLHDYAIWHEVNGHSPKTIKWYRYTLTTFGRWLAHNGRSTAITDITIADARASNASSQTFMGLGLGLYLSKALIEAQGGTMMVHSVEGQGATFTLTLPIYEGGNT